MKKLLTFALTLCTATLFGQYNITEGGSVQIECGPQTVLTDSEANAGNYAADESYQMTFCPGEGGSIVSIGCDTELGDVWDIGPGDFVYVYDGEDLGAPLIGTYTSTTDPMGFTAFATLDNPTGCVTVLFTSDGSGEAAGFTLSLACFLAPQPFYIGINTVEAANPDDSTEVLICPGETVQFTAQGSYPFSGLGYDQSDETSYFEWSFGDGDTVEGLGSNGFNSTSHTYDDSFGYQVWVTVTDAQGIITTQTINVLVSTEPNFSASGTLDTDFCGGEEIFLTGWYDDPSETISGADANEGTFYAGGIVAGQTYLPDGSGESYTTVIDIGSFPPDQEIVSETDIIEVCLNMEHSYLGDLQAYLSCPDGTQITLFEGYNNGGGGTYLGDPIDDFGGGGPGIGWDYCFSAAGDMTLMEANDAGIYTTTTIEGGNSISPGTYLPENSFADFVGCPVNGEWTITITDNLGIDDGYIFEWSILFDPTINPNVEDYLPIIVDAWWEEDETIISDTTTGIYIVPEGPGDHDYTFVVSDNFGCEWDTVITVEVLPPLDVWASVDEPFQDVCGLEVDMDMNNTVEGGFWNYSEGPDDNPTITEINMTEAVIEVTEYGQYVFIWQDDYCEQDVFATVNFLAAPSISDVEIGPFCPDEQSSLSIVVDGDWQSIEWSNGESDVLGIVVDSTAFYTVEVTGCGVTSTEVIEFETFDCVVIYPNVISPNSDEWNNALIFPNVQQFSYRELFVYDRWGVLVFHAPTYNNGWDGEGLAAGTYYYVLKLEGKDPIQSPLTIVRD